MSRWSRGTGSHWEVEVEAETEIEPAQHGGEKKRQKPGAEGEGERRQTSNDRWWS